MSNKPRRPWIAAILTLLTRGLGHFYVGEPKRGLILLGIELFLVLPLVVITLIIANITFVILTIIGGIAYVVFCMVDSISIARRKKESYEPAKYNRWFVYVGYYIIVSVLFSSPLSSFIKDNFVQAYKIPSGAMISTLLVGDHILANKRIYRAVDPKRGDIIIFPYPKDSSRDFIKRLIGIEGDVIEIRDKRLYLNGKEQSEPYIINIDPVISSDVRDNFGPVTVPPGKLFFMGDNRDQSYDSRFYGFVPRETIKGKAMSLYWSWDSDSHKVRWDRIGKILK